MSTSKHKRSASGRVGVPPAVPRVSRGTTDITVPAEFPILPGSFPETNADCCPDVSCGTRDTAGGTPTLPETCNRVSRVVLVLAFCCFSAGFFVRGDDAAGWRRAEPGWKFEWPRDHAVHPDFKTEWWYFTGNLRATDGRRFGYQVTFFRQGIRAPGERVPAKSRFVVDDFKFGHFTVTDVQAGRFHFSQQLLRGAFGEAGFGDEQKKERLAWLGAWSIGIADRGVMELRAGEGTRSLELRLESAKPWALHGDAGLSTKADVPGHASQYYSGTRMRSRGTLQIDGKSLAVEGESWFDHEWATNQLAPGQSGWDWFSVQLDDGSELMIYRLRKKDGSVGGASSGSFIATDGSVRHLRLDELRLTPVKFWQSTKTRGRYPIGWRVEVPPLGIDLEVTTPVEAQELALDPLAYWEGMIDVRGKRDGRAVNGHGYLELTGYAGDVVGLSAPE
jgi:predicted secreted hydrolase